MSRSIKVPSTEPLTGNELSTVASLGVALALVNATDRAVRVLDFGGADGHHADLVAGAFPSVAFDWSVVELPSVVARMQTNARPGLTFLADLDAALGEGPDIAFASASLNYVSEPQALLHRLLGRCSVTVLTRLPLWPIPEHQVAIQRPQRRPTEISYPTWFFSEARLLAQIAPAADVLLRFVCPDDRAFFAGHYGFYQGLVLTERSTGPSNAT